MKPIISEIQRDDFLVVADSYQQHLYQIGMKTGKVNPIVTSELYRPIAVGYDPVTQKVHWTDNEAKVVKSASIYGTSEIVLQANPEGTKLYSYYSICFSLMNTKLPDIFKPISVECFFFNKLIDSTKTEKHSRIT